jgi:hypothetical protein
MYKIKRFNEDNEGFNYTEISPGDYIRICFNGMREIDIRKSEMLYLTKHTTASIRIEGHDYNNKPLIVCETNNGYEFSFLKHDDDWFYANCDLSKNHPNFNHTNPHKNEQLYYKCDQIKGVVELIKYYENKDV